MSTQKDKFLASAQKYIQKGQFERAIKDYEQVVTADPKDVKHRQKLAELLVRGNRKEDAVREYETIAKYYDENGFYLKSIAVYKQIQRLDPSNMEISISLAQLNEKQGLVGNALGEYKTVFDHYQKSGRTDDAISILEKMKGVDPQNVDIRMKLAETCFSAGHGDRAYREFTAVALSLKDRGNKEIFDRVCQRIQELFPDKKESMLDILAEQVRCGIVAEPIPKLCRMLEETPGNTRVMAVLAEAYRISGDVTNRKDMLHRILLTTPDDSEAIKGIIACAVEEGALEESVSLLMQYLSVLFAAGCFADVERYLTKLLEQAPYDVRLLDGLKQLYETTGEQDKLADVQVSIAILSRESADQVPPESDDSSLVADAGETNGQDFPWQDEIDLSLAPEVGSDSMEEIPEAGPVMLSAEDLSSEVDTATEPVANPFEIDISFDLSDLQEMDATEEVETVQKDIALEQSQVEQTIRSGEEALPNFMEGFELELHTDADYPSPADETADMEMPGNIELVSVDDTDSPEMALPLEEQVITLSEELPEAEIIPGQEIPEEKPAVAISTSLFDMIPDEAESDGYGQEGSLAKFKESPDSQVDSHDTETRYNLGIAYMEMALYDEAIGEFRAASIDPGRTLDCLTLEGVCHGKKGDFAGAERVLLDALSLEGLDVDRVLSLRYELGVLHETAGNREEALKDFREVFHTNPGFRDTMKRIARLSGNGSSSFDLSDINDADIELDELA